MAKREAKRRAASADVGGPDDAHERALGAPDLRIAGVDEAGRGPIAGPVVAAAVALDWTRAPAGLNDSKKLGEAKREALFEEILAHHGVAVALASAATIDATDIRAATLDAMRRAVKGLALAPDHVLIDGLDVPPGLPCPGTALVKGDARSVSIAAASIVAKVIRDRLMTRAGETHPGWSFEIHKGYGTAAHVAALANEGASPLHRRSFAPVAETLGVVREPKRRSTKARAQRTKTADLFERD
ncbi:MAG: ribonuclease HII [Hyphomicrobiales bacterium]|nr:ribonuclease HII [Hyphomicrobiales bacterium]